jgi:ParB family chromosome partitioning protein
VTEALSIANLPNDIKDECRRADIQSKSLLLQVVRQPAGDSMRELLKRITQQGMTRDEARQARLKPKAKKGPYLFRHNDPERGCTIEVRFRRSSATPAEVISALEAAIVRLHESDNT